MNSDEQKVLDLFSEITGLSSADKALGFTDMPGWDSLRFAEFVISLQDQFAIRFSPAEIAALVNLSAAIQIVTEKRT